MNFHEQLLTKYPDGKIPVRKSSAVKANQPVRATDSELVNRTAKAGLLASADAAEREGKEWQRKADEKMEAVKRVSDRTLINHYTEQAREYRAHAELSRSRAESFRRAAANVGQ